MAGAGYDRHMVIQGERVRLRLAGTADIDALVRIRQQPEVRRWWRGDDIAAELAEDLDDPGLTLFIIETPDGDVLGGIQFHEEEDPDYSHAGIDIFVDPSRHGRGYGTDAVRTLVRYLIEVRGHHRLTIDPAADNATAIRVYRKVGFRPVGVMRRYEKGLDGTWHDGLLMDLITEDLADAQHKSDESDG